MFCALLFHQVTCTLIIFLLLERGYMKKAEYSQVCHANRRMRMTIELGVY